MAVTVTVAQLAEATRLTIMGSPDPPYLAILTRHLAAATATISQFVDVDTVPEDVLNEAVIMLVAYRLDAAPARPGRTVNTFASSGAQAMLSPWAIPVHVTAA